MSRWILDSLCLQCAAAAKREKKPRPSEMTNIWAWNCCGEFKTTVKVIQAISDLGQSGKSQTGENYKVFFLDFFK